MGEILETIYEAGSIYFNNLNNIDTPILVISGALLVLSGYVAYRTITIEKRIQKKESSRLEQITEINPHDEFISGNLE